MARFGRKRKEDAEVEILGSDDLAPVADAVVAGTQFSLVLPSSPTLGRRDARDLVAHLPGDLSGCVVNADGEHTTFLGPMFIAELIDQIAVQRHALLVVRGVETLAGSRFVEAAFNAGVTSRVDVAATVPFAVAIRRAPVGELTS